MARCPLTRRSEGLCDAVVTYVQTVAQQLLRAQSNVAHYLGIYHELLRVLGAVISRRPQFCPRVQKILNDVHGQVEHVDPYVSLSFLNTTLFFSSEFMTNYTQKINAFIAQVLVKKGRFVDSVLVAETLRTIHRHSPQITDELFFPFSALALHSTAIQRAILPLIHHFVKKSALPVLDYIIDLPILATLLQMVPPGTADPEGLMTTYAAHYAYLYSESYVDTPLWSHENSAKTHELMNRPEARSGRVAAVNCCVPALLRVFFQAVCIKYCTESEALSLVRVIVKRYETLFPDENFQKSVRDTFLYVLNPLTQAYPCVLSILVARLSSLLKDPEFLDGTLKINFANQLCMLIGEHANLIRQEEADFLLAEVDPQIFEDSNYPEVLQASLLSLYCKLGHVAGQDSKVKITLSKYIDQIKQYPMLSQRATELYAMFATPGMTEMIFKQLMFQYLDEEAPLPALLSTLDVADAQPLHPFSLFSSCEKQ